MPVARTIIDALTEWVGSQRWFVGGGMPPQLALISSVSLHSDAKTQVHVMVVSDDGGALPVFYQVPIVLRRERREESDLGFIGTVFSGSVFIGTVGEENDEWFAYDGPTDSAFTQRLLALLEGGGTFGGHLARVHSSPGANLHEGTLQSTVLRREQSNTSIVFSDDDAPRIICKIFRMLHHGDNPDVVLQSALYDAGSTSVPSIVGTVVGEWPDASQPSGTARGHLAFAQNFLAGAEDGWARALGAVSQGADSRCADFTEEARRMGAATADVHATLASVMPSREASAEDVAFTLFEWQRRLDAAIAEVPELAFTRWSIEALYARAEFATWPRLQRIHGDLHLGQVLTTPNGAWAIIDFEGEPMRPLEERSRLDHPLRDIAGMLRSIDYAAGSHTASAGVLEWAKACREAFLDGYIECSHDDVRQSPDLLDAFELDKALYEVVYEARTRPAWLPIPIAAVRRLAHNAESSANGVLTRAR